MWGHKESKCLEGTRPDHLLDRNLSYSILSGPNSRRGQLQNRLSKLLPPGSKVDVSYLICQKWGVPDVNILASRMNCLCCQKLRSSSSSPRYVGVIPRCQFRLIYAFPPVRILLRLLKNIDKRKTVILSASNWPRITWYTDTLRLPADNPWLPPNRPGLLS